MCSYSLLHSCYVLANGKRPTGWDPCGSLISVITPYFLVRSAKIDAASWYTGLITEVFFGIGRGYTLILLLLINLLKLKLLKFCGCDTHDEIRMINAPRFGVEHHFEILLPYMTKRLNRPVLMTSLLFVPS